MDLEKKLKHYRLNREEYDLINQKLGRPPEGVEWALFSALWSEHCSYKSSRVHLKKLFNKSPRVVMSFGENAGVVDLGQGERVGFKMESHNHPSYIEPYEGAATGVGGILRDIFTMGARPIALANYLCFGEPTAGRMPTLVDGVVRGIGGYGNCVGVPTITGQTEFHKSYNKNILVNALAVGLFRKDEPILSSKAKGVGNLVVYVGAKTGKDGVHGASMASESFDDKNESKKPTIQKGDPFYEKLLIESCIEVMQAGLVVAIQDMGAAGLTSSSIEMAAKGDVGFDMHLDRVPLRDSTMVPEEILLSESQERMLMIVEPANMEKVKQVFAKWDLDAVAIGEVTKGPNVRLFWHDEKICDIDPKILTDDAPMYQRPFQKWNGKNRVDQITVETKSNDSTTLQKFLNDVRGTNRRWIYEQYDQRVGAKTAADCREPVGAIRLPDSKRGLGLVLGCRPHVMRHDAKLGAIDAIAYPAIELSAKGFLPLAATDCLNFGNPENSEIMSEFVATVEGMSEQCEALNVPIISGNVSFYNETLGQNITSTPATGLVGLRDNVDAIPKSYFREKNQEIFLLEMKGCEISGLRAEMNSRPYEVCGELQSPQVAKFCDVTRHLSLVKGVQSTRVVGKFGLAYALARMCHENIGADVRGVNGIFAEKLYQVVFVVTTEQAHALRTLFQSLGSNFSFERIGSTKENVFRINDEIQLSVSELLTAYDSGWEKNFAGIS